MVYNEGQTGTTPSCGCPLEHLQVAIRIAECRNWATANVLFARKRSGGIELPLSALTAIESRPTVWVVGEGERLASRPVLIGAMRERGVEVVQGVQAGERVVVAGVHLLIEGEQVRVREVGAPVALDVSR